MSSRKFQLPPTLELSLLLFALGFLIPCSLFLFQQAISLFQLAISLQFKALPSFPDVSKLPSITTASKLAAIIFFWSSIATLVSVLCVYITKRSINLSRQILDKFQTDTIFGFLDKLLTVVLMSAIFGTSVSSTFFGLFLF